MMTCTGWLFLRGSDS